MYSTQAALEPSTGLEVSAVLYFIEIKNWFCKCANRIPQYEVWMWEDNFVFFSDHLAFENLLFAAKAKTWHTSESPVPTTAFLGWSRKAMSDENLCDVFKCEENDKF